MFAAWVLSMTACVFAGIGVKWTVDRVWPPPPRLLEIPPEAKPHEPRLIALDDTMDVLGAGVDVGLRMGRHSRSADDRQVEIQVAESTNPAIWISDPPPTEKPADWWPDEIEAWMTPRPGQP
jgi:hypothetical protein